ncbi:hypothetical protein CM49_03599 [Paenibacillus sp. P1XP2]|nr:hypothetical protein CM49_03599 [Paenibacillus sp. P1XP2]
MEGIEDRETGEISNMIQTTKELIHRLEADPRTDSAIITAYCRIISVYGDDEDARALFRYLRKIRRITGACCSLIR